MICIAIDPGYRRSAFVVYDGVRVLDHQIADNVDVLAHLEGLPHGDDAVLVLEEMQLFGGFNVGKEIFDSVFWSGRFAQAWQPRPWDRILRSQVRAHLHASKGGDAAVRQALIARFGPYKDDAIGSKRSPGPLYGLKSDEWSALAIAVAWSDRQAAVLTERTGTHV